MNGRYVLDDLSSSSLSDLGLAKAGRSDIAHRGEACKCTLYYADRGQLRRWADLVVVAPCSADMLAKVAGGLCDTLAVRTLLFETQNILTNSSHCCEHCRRRHLSYSVLP